jgi:hypothetical protein
MIERTFQNDYYEELFGKAVREVFNSELEETSDEPIEYSKRHSAKMEKLLTEADKTADKKTANIITIERQDSHRVSFERLQTDKSREIASGRHLLASGRHLPAAAKWAMRIAATFVLMFAAVSGYFLSVPEVREAVIGVITGETVSGATAVMTDPEDIPEPAAAPSTDLPKETFTIPPEFQLEEIRINAYFIIDKDGKITEANYPISIKQVGGSIMGDENSLGYYSVENGVTYRVYESLIENRPSLVLWESDNMELWIFGEKSANELLKRAKEIEKNK